ncbi:putative toxin-antitoxin system toxin component, PIN family [Dyadobacter jiangsuensis]|uniref:putative toxin-antitoxin system toxin component, PIN family n=1 Tax=Dyadobacter fermentans TaxID=94254 RepID=UPI001CBC0A00|nr:putative toxin-antitoxin system toxin component, PIN family [Dyadobacter fermentans]MBZ1356784.1 putative toxin-antitoxin system toxin component, PIN family [Dyadobacter fermentans]
MEIVLDTNVLLVSLPTHSKYHPIFQALLRKEYDLFISNETLMEYEEQIGRRLGIERTELQLIELLNLSNVYRVIPYYFWQLIEQDADDNKFIDCAVSAGADYLVSNDRHFDVLASIDFPKVEVIRAETFLEMLT